MSLLIVGSVALDTVETPFGKVKEVLGGSAIYSSIAARFFTTPSVVAVVGTDFPKEYIDMLTNYGIDIKGLQQIKGKTFRWVGHYMYDLNSATTIDTQLNVFKDFNPKIPREYKDIKHIFLANIDPELQYSVYTQMSNLSVVACDTMNFWIKNKNKELKKLLKVIDIFLVNEAEVRQLAQEVNIIKAARCVLNMGPKMLIVKRGEYGAMCFQKNGKCFSNKNIFVVPSYPLENVFDPTGAGDSFAGGFMGYIAKNKKINNQILRQAIILGSVTGSFCVENFSIEGLVKRKYKDIIKRYLEIKSFTHFEEIGC
jgi:sugar/nucleoside kinase (ribokinase family)